MTTSKSNENISEEPFSDPYLLEVIYGIFEDDLCLTFDDLFRKLCLSGSLLPTAPIGDAVHELLKQKEIALLFYYPNTYLAITGLDPDGVEKISEILLLG